MKWLQKYQDRLYNHDDTPFTSPPPKSTGVKRHEDGSRDTTPGTRKPGLWDKTQMRAGWGQGSFEVPLGNAMQFLLIFPEVKFSTCSFLLPFPESLWSTQGIYGSATQSAYLYIFTCTHVCTWLLGRFEWCSNELQWGGLGTPGRSVSTTQTMLPLWGHRRV